MRRVPLDNSASLHLEKLDLRMKNVVGALPESIFVSVGDIIQVDHDAGFLRGHGTQVVDGKLMATVCGTVERVNKLISVRPLKSRYTAETGDVVVGRVVQVVPKRWKVDVNGRQHAALMLSAVNLPGGIQRRRTADDELNMRLFFEENDVISAEVQSFHADGSMSLHTRSDKYGKLGNGQLLLVAPYLVKRLKQHFQVLQPCDVAVILGVNGYIWVSMPTPSPAAHAATAAAVPAALPPHSAQPATHHPSQVEDIGYGGVGALKGQVVVEGGDSAFEKQQKEEEWGKGGERKGAFVGADVRERICRVANGIRVLNELGLMIYPQSIVAVYEASRSWGVHVKDMLKPHFILKFAETDITRREDLSASM